jgi:protein-tyrosine phosphatase
MAEFVMKHLLAEAGRADVEVESAALHTDAIGCDTHRGTRTVLAERGIPFFRREARLIDAATARGYDLIVGMDDYNIADLKRLVYPGDAAKIRKLLDYTGEKRDVADPWYTGNFDETYDDVLAGCKALLETLG